MQNQQTQKLHPARLPSLLIGILILVLFFLLLNPSPWSGSSIQDTRGSVGFQENPWVLRQGETVLETQLTLPEYRELETGQLYSMTTTLTYDGTRDEMPYGFLHLDHAYCRVLLDGQVLFSCMPEDVEKWDASKSPGFIYKAFPMPRDTLGKELEVQILPPLTTPVEYGLPQLWFGDFTSTLHAAVIRDMPHDVVMLLCILLGVAAILFSTGTLQGSNYREGISIGAFSLLFSLYMVTECQINSYFIGNPYYTYLLNYLSFSLIPISLMGFMRERLLEKHRKLCTAVITAELLFFLVELFLHFSGILDMRELIPAIHLCYFAGVSLVTFLILTMKDRRRRRSLVFQMLPVLVGMLIDGCIYWLHLQIGSNDATFTIHGVTIFLIIELVHVWRSSLSIYLESARSNLYRKMAFVDELTGAGNRRAFDNEIEQIASGEKQFRSMLVVSADVNRLKYVNDHFGHAAGDKLIYSAAHILTDMVSDGGKVFRTGGDEFSAFLYDIELSQYEKMLQSSQKQYEAFNRENPFALSVAMGCVQIFDNHILEAVQEADRRMYANKAAMKQSRDYDAASQLQT